MDEDGEDDDHIYTHKMAYYSAIKKKERMPFAAI